MSQQTRDDGIDVTLPEDAPHQTAVTNVLAEAIAQAGPSLVEIVADPDLI